jgi:hypothetical protein
MSSSELRTKVWQEIQNIPENKLIELFDLIHSFRLHTESINPQSILQFAGCWSDLPNETYTAFLDDISLRRQQAFSQRQNREVSPG